MKPRVIYNDMGLTRYAECWDLQRGIFDFLVRGKADVAGQSGADPCSGGLGQTLILCEHPHVYTLGKSGAEGNMLIREDFLKSIGAEYCRVDRGGDITYHGPGQLVGYPILDIENLGLGLKDYIHTLEQAVIDTIADFGIRGERSEGATGVWLPADKKGGLRKISAIGVRSSRYVTMHGFSLNVNPQMEYFTYINPCGFIDRGVTSMEKETGAKVDMDAVKCSFRKHFETRFGVELDYGTT